MEEKLSLLKQLYSLASTDHKVKEEEYEFLLKISQMLGISQTDFELLLKQDVAFIPPKPETNRILQFQRLILLANVDTKVNEVELSFLRRAGIKLGLHPDAVETVFREMKQREFGVIPPEVLIKIFQVYHN
jgi:uncharacterized tellurite resistance protein B-like protein